MSDSVKKKETSYTYWVKKDDNFFDGIDVNCAPTKVEQVIEEEVKGHSAWNKSGTWEEKKLNLEELQQFFNQNQIESFQDTRLTFNQISGTGNIVYINGKIKPGYNINFTVSYGEGKNMDIKNFQDDGDYEFEITDDDKNSKQSISKKMDDLIHNLMVLVKKYAQQC